MNQPIPYKTLPQGENQHRFGVPLSANPVEVILAFERVELGTSKMSQTYIWALKVMTKFGMRIRL